MQKKITNRFRKAVVKNRDKTGNKKSGGNHNGSVGDGLSASWPAYVRKLSSGILEVVDKFIHISSIKKRRDRRAFP